MTKLQSITKGYQIIDQIFWELIKLLKNKNNLTERDLAKQIRRMGKKMARLPSPSAQADGGQAFPPIVSFGSSSAEIHHKPGNQKIGRNNFLMLDYGVKVNGYCSDFTRTLFLGSPTKYHEKIYNIVLAAQSKALGKVKIGANCVDIDLTARNIIAAAGFAKYYNHSTGHGVGRKIHEAPSFSPVSSSTLSPAPSPLIMTVEPGIYLPGKFGVRIEDMILVSKNPRIFSKVPKDFESMVIR